MTPTVLRLRRIGIDTYQEPVVHMSNECSVGRSEGWEALTRLQVSHGSHVILATLHVVTSDLLAPHEVSLSDAAWRLLGASEGDVVGLSSSPPLESLTDLRSKVHGRRLDREQLHAIVADIAAGRYSAVHLSAFVTACAGGRLDLDETIALTHAMLDVGERLVWERGPIVGKHSVGGIPGNRTTVLVVPIVASLGLTMPKTSSRAITSHGGDGRRDGDARAGRRFPASTTLTFGLDLAPDGQTASVPLSPRDRSAVLWVAPEHGGCWRAGVRVPTVLALHR